MFGQYKGNQIKIIKTTYGYAYLVNGERSIVSTFTDEQNAWDNAIADIDAGHWN